MYPKLMFSGIILSSTLLLGACATDPMHDSTTSGLSDNSLNSNVAQAVQRVPGVGPNDISVSSQNGTVTLRGRTQTRTQAQDAIEAARHVPGVQKVDYDIHVDDH